MEKGIIEKKLEKGFGFIKTDASEKELFFHANEVQNIDFNSLNEGDEVEFEIAEGQKGPQAVNVSKVSTEAEA